MKQLMMTDTTVFVDTLGTLGLASEVTPPKVKMVKAERKTLGGVGTQKLPTGKVEVDSAKIVFNSFYPEIFNKVSNPFQSFVVLILGNLMEFENGAAVSNKQAKLIMRCTAAELGMLGDMKEHDNMNYELNLDPSSAVLICDDKELYNIDIDNNQYIVNGVDLRKSILKNLGVT